MPLANVRTICALVIALCSAMSPLSSAEDRPLVLAHEGAELKTDASVTWGRLPNGLIYAIMPNNEPKDKLSLRLFVNVGSMHEMEAEQGLAHYLEHMGFNGSKNFPKANQVVEELQKIGVAFGRDSNAHTSFDETVYKLDMPNADAETLALGLKVFADWSADLFIKDEEVDNERGIILSEMRDREGPQMRIWQGIYPRIFPGLNIGQRFPIGTKETITAMSGEQIRAFYNNWYRLDRMVLCVVGAVDPKQTVEAINAAFAEIPATEAAVKHNDRGDFAPAPELQFYAQHEAESSSTFLYYAVTKPHVFRADGIERRRLSLHKRLVNSIMNRRLQDYVEDHTDGPVLSGGLSIYDRYGVDIAAISVQPKPGQILESMAVLEQELRRFRQFGPSKSELDIAIANIKAGLEQAVARKNTRNNKRLATSLYTAVKYGTVFQTPEQNQELVLSLIKEVRLEDVQAAVDIAFNGGHQFIGLFGRDSIGDDAVAQLQKAWDASANVPVAAPEAAVAAIWAYAQQPEAVAPTKSHDVAFDIHQRIYANEARVNLLARDEKENEILFNIRIDAERPPFKAGVLEAFSAFMGGGLGKHNPKELRQVLAGKRSNIRVAADLEGIYIGGSCPPEELELLLQQARAWITDAAWSDEGFKRLQPQWFEGLKAAETNLDQIAAEKFAMLTGGGITFARSASLAEAERVTWEDVKTWGQSVLANGAMEVSLVGDFDLEQAKTLCDAYIGSLAKRSSLRVVADLEADGALLPIAAVKPGYFSAEVAASVKRGLIKCVWPTDDATSVKRNRRLSQLSRVVSELLRKEIREKFADAYSPYAVNSSSMHFENHGLFVLNVGVAPERVQEVETMLRSIVSSLLKDGISDDVFERVMTPTIKSLAAYRSGNSYWMHSVVSRSQSQPQRLEWASNMEADYQSMTKDDLMVLAKAHLNAEPLVIIVKSNGDKSEAGTEAESKAETAE